MRRPFAASVAKAEGAARMIAHQGFAQAKHDLAHQIVSIEGDRIRSMKDESIVGGYHFLDQDRHREVFVGEAHGSPT